MVSENNKRQLVIFGIGFFGKKLIEKLPKEWKITAVDIDSSKIEQLQQQFSSRDNVQFIAGDASSILTWKKLELDSVKYIITTIKDSDVSLEVCRIAREVFSLDASLLVLLFNEEEEEKFGRFNASVVKPAEIITSTVISKIEKNYTVAVNIGLGKGEIIEVHIVSRSHLVDRKLKYLKPTRWRIAAIYRNGELIIPSGEEKLKVGDRVVIIGDPVVLENLVNILLKGTPQFPLQFGTNFATVYHPKYRKTFEETAYLKKNSKAHKLLIYPLGRYDIRKDFEYIKENVQNFEVKTPVSSPVELFNQKDSIGVVSIPFKNSHLFSWFRLKKIFTAAAKPFLLSRGNFPYKGIVVSLNCPDPAFLLEIGIEISRLMKLPFEVVYGVMPEELRSIEEQEDLKERNSIISDFEHIYKAGIKYSVLEGNPVKKTLEYMQERSEHLLLVSYDKNEKISPFNPSVPFYIAKNSKTSVLCFPVEESYE
ncbi:NAD-binding protein [Persephonella sp.]